MSWSLCLFPRKRCIFSLHAKGEKWVFYWKTDALINILQKSRTQQLLSKRLQPQQEEKRWKKLKIIFFFFSNKSVLYGFTLCSFINNLSVSMTFIAQHGIILLHTEIHRSWLTFNLLFSPLTCFDLLRCNFDPESCSKVTEGGDAFFPLKSLKKQPVHKQPARVCQLRFALCAALAGFTAGGGASLW